MEKSSGYDYEVFLSFRGPDTRRDITDFLYTSMIDAGIRVYKDDEELRIGEEIGGQLLHAIEQSKISIPIFSKGYADSAWCLRELVKMVESKNTRRHKIMPIFYDVAPSEVKYQTEHYSNAIVSHANKKRFDDKTINKWKDALNEVGALKGWDLHSMPNRGKGEFVKEVINNVLTELKTAYLEVSDCLVEVDNHVGEIMRIIDAHVPETKIVGIYGIGGMGKTTIAKLVYNQLSKDLSNCCFLSNIRETEITFLQNQLISTILKNKWPPINNIMEGKKVIKERICSKRVLLLLDDVDKASQLDALMQKREWFGKGSKIIITTRDQGILNVPTLVDGTYELTGMDFDLSLQLLSKHAFRRDYPLEQYISHSKRAANICGGLPLALEVIGSLLSGKSVEEWDTILKELEEFPQDDVQRKLMISIEALNEDQNRIFLDVACFFIGFDKRIVIHMWENCKFLPHQSIGILQQRSLIKIGPDNRLWMHDWLRDVGRNIIQQRSGRKPEKQQWVWTHAQASKVLEKMQIGGHVHGIGNIEAICFKFDELSQYSSIKECLASLSNLRFLQVDSKDFNRNMTSIATQAGYFLYYHWSNFLQTTFGPLILPELRWLSWNYFPTIFKVTHFSMRKLVILDFSRSKITEKWDGWSHIKLAVNLKVLNLTGCGELHKTPNLSFHVNLEWLILEQCYSLVQIDSSIGHLKKLVFLNLKYCPRLRKLPHEMDALESLTELRLDSTSIEEIPEWRSMEKLEILSLVECRSLNKFNFVGCAASTMKPSLVDNHLTPLCKSIENFNSLIELDLSGSKIQELCDSIGNMKNLKVLKICKSSIKKLPGTIGMLEKLEELVVGGQHFEGELPSNIGKLSCLRILVLHSPTISAVPPLPESLITLHIDSRSTKTLPDLSNLLNLRTLQLYLGGNLNDPPKLEEAPSLWWIGRLSMLEVLRLHSPFITTISSDLVFLSQLKRLELTSYNLQCLPRLTTSLSHLEICFCRRIKTTNDLSNLKDLSYLQVTHCDELTEIQGLEGLENLRTLHLRELPSLAKLPDIIKLKKLKEIHLEECKKLLVIQGCPELLEILHIDSCSNLQELPDLTNLKKLKEIYIRSCNKLFEIRGSPESLEKLSLVNCIYLQKLPDPSSFKNLKVWNTDEMDFSFLGL